MPAFLFCDSMFSALTLINPSATGQGCSVKAFGGMAASMPLELASGGIVLAVAAGYIHGLALLINGSVLGWDFSTNTRILPLPEGRVATQIAAGPYSSFVILDSGALLAWVIAKPTNGSPVDIVTWVTMDVPLQGASVVSVADAFFFTVIALSNGSIAGLGYNTDGQLSFPPELLQPGAGVVQVAAGDAHTVALTSDGRVYALGYNRYHQCSVPASVQGRAVRKVGAGAFASYALLGGNNGTSGGELLLWGKDDYGQQTALQGLTNVVDFAAGWDHVVVLLATGEARAFGSNHYEQVRATK
jgi:alpha-tubulin suppressor-like RCC1 family protein